MKLTLALTGSKWRQSWNKWLFVVDYSESTDWTFSSIPSEVNHALPHIFTVWPNTENWIKILFRITFSLGNDSLGGSKKQLCLAQDCPKCPFSYFIIGNGARESNCRQNVDSSWHAFDSSRKGALRHPVTPLIHLLMSPCVSKAWPWSVCVFFFFLKYSLSTLLPIWF